MLRWRIQKRKDLTIQFLNNIHTQTSKVTAEND